MLGARNRVVSLGMNPSVPWYLNPGFLPAASGLLGVIVGGLITAVSTYFLDERRAAREKAKETRSETLEMIRAARALDQDIALALEETRSILKGNQRIKKPHNPVATDGWRANAQIIAPSLSLDGWDGLTVARMVMENLHSFYGQPDHEVLNAPAVKMLTGSVDVLQRAREILRSLISEAT